MSKKAFKYKLGEDFALRMDVEDPLAVFRNRFYHIPNSIYMDGKGVVLETIKPTTMLNMFDEPSLSATAKEVETAIEEIMHEAAK